MSQQILRALGVLCALGGFIFPVSAQIGDKSDKPGVVQKPIVPRELIPPAPVRTAAEELKTFQIAPGFRIELAAADPLVQDPVAMAIDPQGRMWVVEMRSYMPDLDGNGEDHPTGRVSVLEDTDGDGRFDKSTVFLDKLIMPRALCLVRDGVLIGAPPKLWFCRDTNGDLKCDEQVEVATDYGIQVDPKRPELANPERAPNAPLYALDNWIYNGAYTGKFRWRDGKWERGVTTFRGQWGLSQDDFGRLYHGSNSDQLRCDVVPSHYLGRNPNYPRPTGANVKVPENQLVWPARVNPGINRGYRPEMLRAGKLKEFTAACSPFIYRADLFGPEFYGNAFVCEPAGNLIKRNILTETDGSVTAREAYKQREFFTSTDERFRPVNLYTGPDGALYVVDLYRGVLQHRISLTSYLRQQSEERALDKGIHLGRIWRIVPDGKVMPRVKPDFAKQTPAQWVAHLSHANAWWRETTQRLLVEKGDLSVVPALQQLATGGKEPLGRMHALWTLEGLRQFDPRTVTAALKDKDERVRVAAVRVSETLFDGEDKGEAVTALLKLGNDSAPQVQLQLALTLGQARDAKADAAMANLVRAHATGNKFLADAVVTGLFGRELELLETLSASKAWSQSATNMDKFLGALARCVFAERKAERVERLLTLIAHQPKTQAKRQLALLDGAMSAAAATRKPVKFAEEPPVLAELKKLGGGLVKTRVAKLDSSLVWPGKPGVPPEPVIPSLTAAQQARYDLGKELFTATCAACHQTHGLGLEGLAPPLADSEWVLGSEQRLIRIVLHGVSGPLKVKGASYSLDMPAMGVFDDEQTAAILTYIRREWENGAPPVEPTTVKQIRGAHASRTDAWRQEELLKVP
ncbi:MAG: c-type cytochrome [Verrucomicrobia bacterium]|nr:c-type cytochrome [Verrucomicrobiota bacterium]